jgi:hypothetical protein
VHNRPGKVKQNTYAPPSLRRLKSSVDLMRDSDEVKMLEAPVFIKMKPLDA